MAVASFIRKKGEIHSRERAWIDILQAEGYALLLPASFASRGYGSLCKTKNRLVTPEGQRPHDAIGAVQYLATRPEIDPKRIAFLGWSNGAMTGLHAVRMGADAEPAPNRRMREQLSCFIRAALPSRDHIQIMKRAYQP